MLHHAKRAPWVGLALGLVITLQADGVRADDLVRKLSEGDDDLMTRALGPSTALVQDVVRSTEIGGGKVTLIGFALDKEDLYGHLLVERSPGQFEHVVFPSCGEEGDTPELMAVFFARTEKGRPRDLAVLCRWEQVHADVNGVLYGAEFYRVDASGPKTVVAPLKQLIKEFTTGDLVRQDAHGKWIKDSKATFTTAAGVKNILAKKGLKQLP